VTVGRGPTLGVVATRSAVDRDRRPGHGQTGDIPATCLYRSLQVVTIFPAPRFSGQASEPGLTTVSLLLFPTSREDRQTPWLWVGDCQWGRRLKLLQGYPRRSFGQAPLRPSG